MWLVYIAMLGVGLSDELPAPRPQPAAFDGEWTLVRLELGGQEVPAGQPRLTVRDNRLHLSSPSDSSPLELFLGPDSRVHRWVPTPGKPATICCPFTPEEWVRKFGDPIYSPGPEQWVVEPVVGNIILVPPMPCKIIPAEPPSPGPEVGLYVAADKQLLIQLLPGSSKAGSGLVLVLRRVAAQP